jgi:hypothetical protein
VAKLEELKENTTISVYPNPVTDHKVQLKLNGVEQGRYMITLVALNGSRQPLASVMINGQLSQAVHLPLNITPGVYRLLVSSADGKHNYTNTINVLE